MFLHILAIRMPENQRKRTIAPNAWASVYNHDARQRPHWRHTKLHSRLYAHEGLLGRLDVLELFGVGTGDTETPQLVYGAQLQSAFRSLDLNPAFFSNLFFFAH